MLFVSKDPLLQKNQTQMKKPSQFNLVFVFVSWFKGNHRHTGRVSTQLINCSTELEKHFKHQLKMLMKTHLIKKSSTCLSTDLMH